jgi:hypothetical protein
MVSVFPDGVYTCDGSFDCSGYTRVYAPIDIPDLVLPVDTSGDRLSVRLSLEPMEDRATINAICDGTWVCNGSNQASMLDAPMQMRIIRPFVCDGSVTSSCSLCDGSIICNGSYTGYDGRYCREDIMEEVI